MARLHVDQKRYISDPLEGETIIIDSVEGRLFLFEGPSAEIWNAICAGPSRAALLGIAGDDSAGAAALGNFLARLETLGLVQEGEEEADDVALPAALDLSALDVTQYDEMSSIITMDPIHDIDPERGWPHKRDG